MIDNTPEQTPPSTPQLDGNEIIHALPLGNNEGRQTPLFVNATTGPKGVRIFITGGDYSFRNIIGEERYARYQKRFEQSDPPANLFKRFLGKIGLS